MTGLTLRNRWAVPWGEIPIVPVDEFRTAVVSAVREGLRLVLLFGVPDTESHVRIVAVLADDTLRNLKALTSRVRDRYPALTPDCPAAHGFEREIAEQCGLVPEGHPWLKPLRRHPPDHLPFVPPRTAYDREAYPFLATAGEQVHEVGLGPVQDDILEPGHFRFQLHGEEVLFLEIQLGYQHRGIERLLETQSPGRAVLVAESIAGDTVIGHAEAFCGALEALARCEKGGYAQAVRGVALELERLANHLGDLAALSASIAFLPAASYFARMRDDCLNLTLELSGSRFGRGLVRPGGVAFDLTSEISARIHGRLHDLKWDLDQVGDMFFENRSVRARLEGVGTLTTSQCEEYAFVGPTARACGMARDVRHDQPYGVFRSAQPMVATAWSGDVSARAHLRRFEARLSIEFVLEQIEHLETGQARRSLESLGADEFVVSLSEGWRGEIVHAVLTDANGGIRRCKVKDPSFHNWWALALAMQGAAISDFPMCNRSFNLSYAGHDL